MLNNFLSKYSFNFLSNIDIDIHEKGLNIYFEKYNTNKNYIFFDIGANAGSFINALQKYNKKFTLYSFEPHPYIYEYLINTYKQDNIIHNKMCVSDKDQSCRIYIPEFSVGLSSMINRQIFSKLKNQQILEIQTQCIKLDTYCTDNNISHIDYIKIDVEGVEYMVLTGAMNLLRNNKISALQVEVGIEESGYTEKDILNTMYKYGYVSQKISPSDYLFYLS
jgi:FkbM family methyltransferase